MNSENHKSMAQLAREITAWRREKGFRTPESIDTMDEKEMMLGKLMLVVTEVSEAAHEVRDGDFKAFSQEIADVFIRLLDICHTTGIDPEAEIAAKMEVNQLRPYRHGKNCSL